MNPLIANFHAELVCLSGKRKGKKKKERRERSMGYVGGELRRENRIRANLNEI